MSHASATHAYVAFRACGHPVYIGVDDGLDARDLASDLARLVADDCYVERHTIEEARVIGVVYCQCVPTRRADKIKSRQQKRENNARKRQGQLWR